MSNVIPTAALWRQLRERTAAATAGGERARLQLSMNHVVGVSLNVAIVGSCTPTRQCRESCYALRGMIAWTNAVRVQARNLLRLQQLEHASIDVVRDEAAWVAGEVRRRGFDVLRVNGSGDLVPGTVRLVNELSRRHRWLQLWIATRKPALAARIVRRQNVAVMLSADRTTPRDTRAAYPRRAASATGVRRRSRARSRWRIRVHR